MAVGDRLTRLRTSPDAGASTARILELGRTIAAALPRDGLSPEDLYDDGRLPT